jgi:transcriptional regulator with XRE-family HTH domain
MKGAKAFSQFLLRKGSSQSEAARTLGVPRMTVWRWLKGAVEPSHLAKETIREKLGFRWPE